MTELLHFSPRAHHTAQQNLDDFVLANEKQSTVFGPELDFRADVWDVSDSLAPKAKRCSTRLHFTRWHENRNLRGAPMIEPFKRFAKAYMRYQQGLRPSKSLEGRLIALRALHDAACDPPLNGGPTQLLPLHFNRAAQLIVGRAAKSSAYQYGVQLELIYKTMADCRLLAQPQTWRSPIRRVEDVSKVGPEFDERRISRLPSPEALAALAAIFRVASTPSDVMVTSAAAIMCAAPERVNEVLRLSIHSEVIAEDGPGSNAYYGLRWYPSKGADPQVKWVVQSMADVVRQAIVKAKTVSAPARELARWYELNPTKVFLPKELEHLRAQTWLNMAELTSVLFEGTPRRTVGRLWCQTYGVPTELRGGKTHVRFSDVEMAVLGMLPRGFPFAYAAQKLRYSEALFIARKHELHATRATYRGMFIWVSLADLYKRLSTREENGRTMFDAYGYREADGSAMRIRTHQFRHYLNTIAQTGGLSQLEIAVWSGRARVSDNKAYDHVSNKDVLAKYRELTAAQNPPSALPAKVDSHGMVLRDHFPKLRVRAAHTTDFGYCGHDFSMLPCQVHQDCLNCDEHFCRKGETSKEQRLSTLLEETESLLKRAEQAVSSGLAGADRWVAHHQGTIQRIRDLLQIVQDPTVATGALIWIGAPQMPSPLAMALQDRQRLLESSLQAIGAEKQGRLPNA